MSNWTQPICDKDWDLRNPGRIAHRIVEEYRDPEICCYCGKETTSGIYVRVNPLDVPYPKRGDD